MKSFLILFGAIAALSIAKAGDFEVKVIKGQRFAQSGTAVSPAPSNPFYFEAVVGGVSGFEPVQNPQVQLPDGSVKSAVATGDDGYGISQSFTSQAALDSAFPVGQYTFSATVNLIGAVKGHADLSAVNFPPTPQVLNFTAAQAFDATSPFTLTWNSFSGSASDDRINLILSDAETGAGITSITDLDPSRTEWTFDPNEFEKNKAIKATLSFIKNGPVSFPGNDELLAGAVTTISETAFTMKTGGGNTTVDTTPPTLTNLSPLDGEMMSNPLSPVLFQFNEAMDITKTSVQWEATLNGLPFDLPLANFSYIWSSDAISLICSYRPTPISGWPAGVSVKWKLNQQPGNPGNLRDVAGNELAASTGGFITAGGLDPCSTSISGALPQTAFFVSKQLNYLQNSPAAAAADPDKGAQAFTFCNLESSALDLDLVTLKVPTSNPFQFKLKATSVPNGATNLHIRMLTENFSARSDLDEAYPAGVYQMELRDQSVTVISSTPLTVTDTGYPPIPHFSDFNAAQTVNGEADFTLPWDAFTGATTNTENVTLNIYDSSNNLVFQAPNECHGLKLAPNANGILIPAKTLQNGQGYTVELTFARFSDRDKTLGTLSGYGFASLTRIDRMSIKTTGGIITPITPAKFN
ncbi:MAG: hypothetical protein JWM99_4018, partial [Verrucomicrobiales bacterium]|nr:hypothetical protein [Verrucomicrobiales bacterium]